MNTHKYQSPKHAWFFSLRCWSWKMPISHIVKESENKTTPDSCIQPVMWFFHQHLNRFYPDAVFKMCGLLLTNRQTNKCRQRTQPPLGEEIKKCREKMQCAKWRHIYGYTTNRGRHPYNTYLISTSNKINSESAPQLLCSGDGTLVLNS